MNPDQTDPSLIKVYTFSCNDKSSLEFIQIKVAKAISRGHFQEKYILANKGLNIHKHLSVMLDYPKFIGSKWMKNQISQERFKLFNSLHTGKILLSADYFQN